MVELAELMYLLLNFTAGLLFWEKNARMLFGNLVVECSRLVLGPEFSFTMNHRAALVHEDQAGQCDARRPLLKK